jgi:hypothetical protein
LVLLIWCAVWRIKILTDTGTGAPALARTAVDLAEIDASPLEVVAHKAAAAGAGVVIEDTSLDVAGADVEVRRGAGAGRGRGHASALADDRARRARLASYTVMTVERGR